MEQIDSNHCGVGSKRGRNHAKVIFGWGQLLPGEAGGPAKAEPPVAHRPGQSRRSVRIPLHTEVMFSVDMRTIRGTTWNISQTGMQVEVFGLQPGNVVQLSFRLPP